MPHGIYPIDFAEMCKKKVGEQWEPSNGTEGQIFIDSWCAECQRDKSMSEGKDFDECTEDEVCEILSASFRGEANEWQYDQNGQPCCTAYIPHGNRIPCEHTIDMFDEAQSK